MWESKGLLPAGNNCETVLLVQQTMEGSSQCESAFEESFWGKKKWVQNTVCKSLFANFDYSLEITLWEKEAVRLAATAHGKWNCGDMPSRL